MTKHVLQYKACGIRRSFGVAYYYEISFHYAVAVSG